MHGILPSLLFNFLLGPQKSTSGVDRGLDTCCLNNEPFKVVHVPHRIHVPGNPIAFTYKHAYTVKLRRGWKVGR